MKHSIIQSINHPFFKDAWELYLNAFPKNERRELVVQEQIMNHIDYNFEMITLNDEFIGFIAWWKFSNLYYIEHFATHEKFRGQGLGHKVLHQFITSVNKLIILEVEHPNASIDKRRIQFYERLNFQVNPYKYQQLPLRKDGLKVDLLIMSYPTNISSLTLNQFEKDFKEKCFLPFIKI